MKTIHFCGLALLALAAGCYSLSKTVTPFTTVEIEDYVKKGKDPRTFALTVYQEGDQPRFAGSFRVHMDQTAESGFRPLEFKYPAPVVSMQSREFDPVDVLIDTTARDSWMDLSAAKLFRVVPLNPPIFRKTPEHVSDPVLGILGHTSRAAFHQLNVENCLFYVRMANGPLGPLGRGALNQVRAGVVGMNFLKVFRYVQINYPARQVVFSSTQDYRVSESNLITTVPYKEIGGALACDGQIIGRPTPIILDSAGDFELVMPLIPPEPIRQVSVGDLVLRKVEAVVPEVPGVGLRETPRIGRRLLAPFKVTIDNRRQVVHFEKP